MFMHVCYPEGDNSTCSLTDAVFLGYTFMVSFAWIGILGQAVLFGRPVHMLLDH